MCETSENQHYINGDIGEGIIHTSSVCWHYATTRESGFAHSTQQ